MVDLDASFSLLIPILARVCRLFLLIETRGYHQKLMRTLSFYFLSPSQDFQFVLPPGVVELGYETATGIIKIDLPIVSSSLSAGNSDLG